MTQFTLGEILGSTSGPALADMIEGVYAACKTMHRGTSRPAYAVKGMLWADETNDPIIVVNYYDGTDDIPVFEVDETNNKTRLYNNGTALRTLLEATSAKSGAYTIQTTDRGKVIIADASSAGFTIGLPAAATAKDGFAVTVVKIDSTSNAVTIDGNSSETLNGAATRDLDAQYQSETYICNGTAWFVATAFNAKNVRSDKTANLTAGYGQTWKDDGNQASGTYTPDITQSNKHKATVTGNISIGALSQDGACLVRLAMDGTGGHTITTTAFSKVYGAINTDASKVNLLLLTKDGSTHEIWINPES